MFVMFLQFFTMVMVLTSLYLLWKFSISKYNNSKKKKKGSYECGFKPLFYSRLPFSVRFFLLLILFIMFDVELSFLLQLPFQYKNFFLKKRLLFLVFFTILLYGLMEEWRRGMLNWVK